MENTEGPTELSLSTRALPRLEAICPSYLHVVVAKVVCRGKAPNSGVRDPRAPSVFNKLLCQKVLP